MSKLWTLDSKNDEDKKLLLCVSPCRSGSTAILHVFGAAGISSYYQPLKTMLRWRSVGQEKYWHLPKNESLIYIKETIGPYNHIESSFNPLNMLIEAGVKPSNIKLLILGREPKQAWNSWEYIWGSKTNKNLFVDSYKTVEKIRIEADALKIKSTVLVYEALEKHRNHIFTELFSFFGLSFNVSILDNWKSKTDANENYSKVIFPQEPDLYYVNNLHGSVESANGISYIKHQINSESADDSEILKAQELYLKWSAICSSRFNIKIHN